MPCTPDPKQGSTLSGDVITYDVFLNEKLPFGGQAELRSAGANCPWVTTTWDGSATGGPDGGPPLFMLQSVKKDADLWMLLSPTSNDPVYPTLLSVDATSDQTILDGFGMLRSQGIDEAYAATGTARDPEKGTMVVQLLAPLSNAPQSGGKVDVGVNGAAAFPGLSGWQLGGETDPSGVALMLNTTAVAYPGQTLNVNVELGGQKQSFKCPSAKGAVTICWIGIGAA
ncbi:MAG: hypothetical protein DYH12_15630 [Sorangiineae bacterium PRO1]|nr:hypothetical protein [Sorangiineae bacterium PRO1]